MVDIEYCFFKLCINKAQYTQKKINHETVASIPIARMEIKELICNVTSSKLSLPFVFNCVTFVFASKIIYTLTAQIPNPEYCLSVS